MLKGVEILERVQYIEPENVEIIYEDHHLVAINKPYGMPSVPGKDSRCSAQDYISKLYPDAKMVHRLDRDTSGVLLAVKSSSDYTTIQQLFASNQVDKTYRAICTNNQAINLGDYGVVKLPICEDYEHRPAQRVDFNLGKESVTKYRVLTRDSQGTHIEFSPITGRTHQIRLHAAHPDGLNSPIVGDPIYGDASLAERMFLHAESIRFRSPFSNEIISICSPSPF
jgi:tRNA pseudouridine32 synthase/23S rRNA pseudouridine746 synthase